MNRFRVLFIIPYIDRKSQWGKWHRGAGNNTFNYGIASIAGYLLAHGIEAIVLDAQFLSDPIKGIAEEIRKIAPDMIGISCFTPTYKAAKETAILCKAASPNSSIVLGGAHPSLYPKETLSDNPVVDYVVFGEGEHTLHELISAITEGKTDLSGINGLGYRADGAVMINKRREFITDIDSLPIPAFSLFPMDRYRIQATSYKRLPTYTIVASRGCPFKCTFCQVQQFLGATMRYKSPEYIIKEILHLRDNFGARGIMFQDSTFTSDRDWAGRFCDLMIKEGIDMTWMCFTRADRVDEALLRKMKRAGCYGMSFGVESANQKSLNLLNKALKVETIVNSVEMALKMGFFVTTTYMLGLPGEDEDDCRNTIRLANRLATHIAHFYLPIPYPESRLFEQCKEDGGIRENITWEDYNMFDDSTPVYVNPKIPRERMLAIKTEAVRGYYLNPRVIFRNLKTIDSIDDIKKYYSAALAISGAFRD